MPVSSILRNAGNLHTFSAKSTCLHSLCVRTVGCCNSSKTTSLGQRGPFGVTASHSTPRHLSMTPKLQIFAKFTSFIGKLVVEADHVEKPVEHKIISTKEPTPLAYDEIISNNIDEYLDTYDENLNTVKYDTSPPQMETVPTKPEKNKPIRLYKKHLRANKSKHYVRFFIHEKLGQPKVTNNFRKMYRLLDSHDVPVDELKYFPDVQLMTEEEICTCIEKLKSFNIHRVFSIFLIQRIFAEIKIGVRETLPIKLKNERKRVIHLLPVRQYLRLCEMLERPDLDIVSLWSKLNEANVYESIGTIETKVSKLVSMGATADIIWNNLELLMISRNPLNLRINLYKKSWYDQDRPFPVDLFRTKSFKDFQHKLNLGTGIVELTKLLGVSVDDFQACWGHLRLSARALVPKVRLCLKMGIPKQDVFNKLSLLSYISLEKCYEMTKLFKNAGLPPSIYVFDVMHVANSIIPQPDAETLAGQSSPPDWTQSVAKNKDNTEVDIQTKHGHPSRGSDVFGGQATSGVVQPSFSLTSGRDEMGLSDSDVDQAKLGSKVIRRSNKIDSSKRSRLVMFNLIAKLLELDPHIKSRMFQCNFPITDVQLLDVSKNFYFLTSKSTAFGAGFTREQIARYPFILIHPHAKVKDVVWSAPRHVKSILSSVASSRRADADTFPMDEGCDSDFEHDSSYQDYSFIIHRKSSETHFSPTMSSPSNDIKTTETSLIQSSSSSLPHEDPPLPSRKNFSLYGETVDKNICAFHRDITITKDPELLYETIFSCPHQHLNLLQYLLEKEDVFGFGSRVQPRLTNHTDFF